MPKIYTNKPPHLPPELKSQSITPLYKRFNFFFLLFIVLTLSALTGIASSLSTIAWLTPPITFQNQVNLLNGLNKETEVISPTMVQQIKQRTVSIYDSRQMVGREFYKEDAYVASSIMISSDGWSAVYKPNYILGEEIFWEAIDYQGEGHNIKNSIFDAKTGILYLKYDGTGFRVISFADTNTLDRVKSVVLYQKDDVKIISLGIKYKVIEGKDFFIWDPQYRFLKDSEYSVGSNLFTSDGGFLGFVGKFGLVEGWQVESQLLTLLSTGELQSKYLGISGFIVDEIYNVNKWKKIDGFYISHIESFYKQQFKVGDVIIKIDGQSINKFNLARQTLQLSQGTSFIVLRNGKEIEVLVQ